MREGYISGFFVCYRILHSAQASSYPRFVNTTPTHLQHYPTSTKCTYNTQFPNLIIRFDRAQNSRYTTNVKTAHINNRTKPHHTNKLSVPKRRRISPFSLKVNKTYLH